MGSNRSERTSKKKLFVSPLSRILKEEKANVQLHEFLLGSLDKDSTEEIEVANRRFEVGIVSLNPAPEIGDQSE